MRRHPIPVVVACLVKYPPFRILLHKKTESVDEHGVKRNPELVGQWELPGGIIEGAETPEEALKREIREELGINIYPVEILYARSVLYKDKKPYLLLFYYCQTNYEPAPDGCEYFRAMDLQGVYQDIISGDKPVLEILINRYGGR